MEKHIYVAERKRGFNFIVIIKSERIRVRFVDGQFKTDDNILAAAIDAIRKKNPGIARRCRKADVAAAEKMAREHREMLKRTGAFKGGITADAARHAMDTSLAERDLKLRNENVDVEEFAKADLQLTEAANIPVKKSVKEPIVDPVAKSSIKIGNNNNLKISATK